MRLSLYYNTTAGEGITRAEICRLLTRHGHSLVQILEKHDTPDQPVSGDALVAAGGDGTVAAAARLVASGDTPLAILPMGTANNIAKSLGVDGPLDQIVERWRPQAPRSIDLGFAGGPWGVRRFVESVGAGLVAQGIAEANASKEQASAPGKLTVLEGAHGYLETLEALTPVRSTIESDGESIEGEFLLVEVLNMPLVGSNLYFAGDVSPTDGLLSIVTVDVEQRDALREYLAHRAGDREVIGPFVSRTVSHIDLVGWPGIHVDDAHLDFKTPARVSIEIDPGALRVL
jgi:diacylglycerol kinase (ATP)